jgi:branched-chain amino acid transport system permease protein
MTSTVPRRVAGAVLLAACAVACLGAPAGAQDEAGPSVGGRLRLPDGEPVEGVTLVVERDGEQVGSATSDPDGEWRVAVAEPGTHQVTIDVGTLPDGVSLRDPDRTTLERVRVRGGLKIATFLLGEGAVTGSGRFERLADLAFDGLRLGLVLAVASLGLSLVFGVTGLTNFAHGELVTFGALVAYLFSTSVVFGNVPLWLAGILATALGGVYGLAHERILFRPLRHRRAGNVALIVVTIGLSQFLRYLYLVVFGGSPRPYDEYTVQVDLDLGPISPRPKDLAVMLVGAAVLVAVAFLLQRSRLGTAMRAVSDSRDLSAASGIDVDRVILVTWVGCGALAALGGVLLGVSETVSWDMGFTLLLLMFATVVLGGIGTGFGPMVGGLVIGLASQLSTYWISPKFRVGVALAVLIGAVLVRPQGLLGRRERIG